MPLPENFESTLLVALELIAGTKNESDLSTEQYERLHLNGTASESSKQAAVAFVHETIMAILLKQEPEEKIDLQKVAVDLIELIDTHGGILRPYEVNALKLPKEWIAAFVAEGVLMQSMAGLTWGQNARRAVREYRKNQEMDRDE